MTRKEAIEHIWDLMLTVAGEFCCSQEERDELRQETLAALAALGVE